jgi:uncharacterized membrane protein
MHFKNYLIPGFLVILILFSGLSTVNAQKPVNEYSSQWKVDALVNKRIKKYAVGEVDKIYN